MTYLVYISTKRFLRKPFIELLCGEWKDEDEVKRVFAKFRPKSEIMSIRKIFVVNRKSGEKNGEKKT